MPPVPASTLVGFFDRTYVINLPQRVDRRRQMEAELRRPAIGPAAGRVRYFAAVRPDEARPFGSLGEKGAFLSHLGVLKEARLDNLTTVLVLEDDAKFDGDFSEKWSAVRQQLDVADWDLVHLGHLQMSGADVSAETNDPRLTPLDPRTGLLGAQCYAVRGRCLDPLINHFERQLRGVLGDDLYGPMSPDGTLNTFTKANPETKRYALIPSVCGQRSSRSDIRPKRFDCIPVLREAASMWRLVRNRLA